MGVYDGYHGKRGFVHVDVRPRAERERIAMWGDWPGEEGVGERRKNGRIKAGKIKAGRREGWKITAGDRREEERRTESVRAWSGGGR